MIELTITPKKVFCKIGINKELPITLSAVLARRIRLSGSLFTSTLGYAQPHSAYNSQNFQQPMIEQVHKIFTYPEKRA